MKETAEPLGLYVHLPFYEAKCSYCHFAIDPRRPGEDRQERYLRALLAEIESVGAGLPADTLYLGWPGETAARWRRNLEGLAAMTPDHVSLYVLEVEGKTLLSHRARQGRLALPDDDLVAALYEETVEFLAGRGIRRYEISNFARPGFASRHNGKYWDDAPFLGFGMAAHSYRSGRRWWNHEAFGAYCRAVETRGGGAAVAGDRVLTDHERTSEALFTGLRRAEGQKLPDFRRRYGLDPLVAWGEPLRDAFAAGLLEVAGDRLRLTPRGVLLSNEVFRAFV